MENNDPSSTLASHPHLVNVIRMNTYVHIYAYMSHLRRGDGREAKAGTRTCSRVRRSRGTEGPESRSETQTKERQMERRSRPGDGDAGVSRRGSPGE